MNETSAGAGGEGAGAGKGIIRWQNPSPNARRVPRLAHVRGGRKGHVRRPEHEALESALHLWSRRNGRIPIEVDVMNSDVLCLG